MQKLKDFREEFTRGVENEGKGGRGGNTHEQLKF